MSTDGIKAIVFDIFGTVVDWRSSLISDLTQWGASRGITRDWAPLVDAWRGAYVPSMESVRKAGSWRKLDALHRESLDKLVVEHGISGLSEADLDHINRGWHRLKPWPDSVSGLTRLKAKYVIGTLSNGNVSLLVNMAKNAALPWDVVLSAEVFHHYKPDPEAYLGAAEILGIRPDELMLAAAHNGDLAAARACGLKTGFVPRPTEYGPHQSRDFGAEGDWDVVAADFNDLATKLGC